VNSLLFIKDDLESNLPLNIAFGKNVNYIPIPVYNYLTRLEWERFSKRMNRIQFHYRNGYFQTPAEEDRYLIPWIGCRALKGKLTLPNTVGPKTLLQIEAIIVTERQNEAARHNAADRDSEQEPGTGTPLDWNAQNTEGNGEHSPVAGANTSAV